jgi:hypothetical protein
MMEGVNLAMIYCKNFCKYHNNIILKSRNILIVEKIMKMDHFSLSHSSPTSEAVSWMCLLFSS